MNQCKSRLSDRGEGGPPSGEMERLGISVSAIGKKIKGPSGNG